MRQKLSSGRGRRCRAHAKCTCRMEAKPYTLNSKPEGVCVCVCVPVCLSGLCAPPSRRTAFGRVSCCGVPFFSVRPARHSKRFADERAAEWDAAHLPVVCGRLPTDF